MIGNMCCQSFLFYYVMILKSIWKATEIYVLWNCRVQSDINYIRECNHFNFIFCLTDTWHFYFRSCMTSSSFFFSPPKINQYLCWNKIYHVNSIFLSLLTLFHLSCCFSGSSGNVRSIREFFWSFWSSGPCSLFRSTFIYFSLVYIVIVVCTYHYTPTPPHPPPSHISNAP